MSVTHSQPARLDDEDLGWMTGRSVEAVSFHEPTLWVLQLSTGGLLSTEFTWRLSATTGLVACSGDHGHWFGLPAPVDAAGLAMSALAGRRIVRAAIRSGAPDLEIHLEGGFLLELLALSQGYECWQVEDPSGRCVIAHGNREMSTWRGRQP